MSSGHISSFGESFTSPLMAQNSNVNEINNLEMEDIDNEEVNVSSGDDDDDGNDGKDNENDNAPQGVNGEGNVNSEEGNANIGDGNANEEDPHANAYKKKARKKTSAVWKHMDEVVLRDGSKKAQCKHCKHYLAIPRTGATTQLHRHIKDCELRKMEDRKQHKLSWEETTNKAGEKASTVSNFKYDQSKVREACSHMILYHEYPFKIVEHVLFNKFMRTVTPYWEPISRTASKGDCVTTYEIEKKKLKTLLKSVNRLSVTTDLWKSGSQKIQYMVVTCHWIDLNWKLQKRVLNFCNVPPPHTGVIIADALHKCLVDWGIENKVQTMTVDNASYNDVALRILKDNFTLKKQLSFGGKLFHVRCCAHIVNLLVKDGLSLIGDVIDCVREGVKYIVASEPRLLKFSEIAKQLQLSSKKLILDCPTRWNGTYMMLAAALEFKDVFPRYQDRDPGFLYVPSFVDWLRVEQVCQFLGVFNEVTNIISGSEYPTSNLFLPEVWRIKEVLDEKSVDDCDFMRSMSLKMKEKFDKYWGECNLLMAIAAVLDPRYKMMLIEFCFPEIYSSEEANRNITMVREALYELYNEYVTLHTSSALVEQNLDYNSRSSSSSSSVASQCVGRGVVSGRSKFESFVRRVDTIQPIKSDLDIYLEEGVYIFDGSSNSHFDALEWWKVNNLKFRILSKMAGDILSILITSVASESTFSAGSRIIDPYRASLARETVQVLLCGSDWVRVLHGLKKKTDTDEKSHTVIHIP